MRAIYIMARIGKCFISISEGIINKNFYERRDYESVDEKSLSSSMSRKKTNSASIVSTNNLKY